MSTVRGWRRPAMTAYLALGIVIASALGPAAAVAAARAAVGESWFYEASCTAVRRCIAVGVRATAAGTDTLAEEWAGGRWRVLPTPNPAGMAQTGLYDVSCASQAACVAVGSAAPLSGGTSTPVAEFWNGRRWRLIPPPALPGTVPAGLNAIRCQAREGCLVLGYYSDGRQLADRWTGSRWLLVPTAGLTRAFFPDGVTCAGSMCMAVGVVYQPKTGHAVPFAERWNGRRWRVLPMPAPRQAAFVQTVTVSCASTAQCLAVGYSDTTNSVPFADRWTRGVGWRLLRLPASAATQLADISCAAVSQCVTVGSRSPGAIPAAPVALVWNGRAWRMLRVPGPVSLSSQFMGVSCPAASGCLAVGLVTIGPNQVARAIAQWWNGRAWQALRLPA